MYPVCPMTPQQEREWSDQGPGGKSRWHHDSSLVSAVVFGNPRRDCRRTRPGSVDPGLKDGEFAGLPSNDSVRRTPRSVTSLSEDASPESDRRSQARKQVPGLSGAGAVGDLVFGSTPTPRRSKSEEAEHLWDGCAGRPSDSREKPSSKQMTLWDLQGYDGYAGLGRKGGKPSMPSSQCPSTSDPGSPSSRASSVEPKAICHPCDPWSFRGAFPNSGGIAPMATQVQC